MTTPQTLQVTVFPDKWAQEMEWQELDTFQLLAFPPEADSKDELGLLKLAKFSGERNAKQCCRTDDFVTEVHGAELDFDGQSGDKDVSYQATVDTLKQAGVAAVIYTSPSHSPAAPKWRVLLPFSKPYAGTTEQMRAYRLAAVKQAEQLLDVTLDSASYALSQAYYFGKVGENYLCDLIDGEYIDQRYDLKPAPVNGTGGKAKAAGFTVTEQQGVDTEAMIGQIKTGEHLHTPLVKLSSCYARAGMKPGDIETTLRAVMELSAARNTGRWRKEWADISRTVEGAMQFRDPSKAKASSLLKGGVSVTHALKELCGVTQNHVANIKKPSYLFKRVFPEGQFVVIVGPPNGGKTSIMEKVCGEIEGEVLFINMDISGAQVPAAYEASVRGGYSLICPDIEPGVSIQDVIALLKEAAYNDEDLTGKVFVIDTIKKITDVMSKRDAPETYKWIRAMTGKGASVIALGHTLKYESEAGNGEKWYAYEGVGDLRSDCDAMCLIEPHIGDLGLVTVSLYWQEQGWPYAKDRGPVEPASWTIDRYNNRETILLDDWINTHQLNKEAAAVRQMSDLVQDIHSVLSGSPGGLNQSELIEQMKRRGYTRHQVLKAIKFATGKAWTDEPGGPHNQTVYLPIPGFRIFQ